MRVDRRAPIRALQRFVANPLVTRALRLGVPDPGDALLETTGRRTGLRRLTPVCDCLEGETFWVVAQRGRRSDWVKNIEHDPHVRVNVRREGTSVWRSGRANLFDSDDSRARARALGRGHPARRLCLQASSSLASDPLTIRIDLDPISAGSCGPNQSGHETVEDN
jgi:deazaflavin-dependent oxidoreductase (nitroreductase family)